LPSGLIDYIPAGRIHPYSKGNDRIIKNL